MNRETINPNETVKERRICELRSELRELESKILSLDKNDRKGAVRKYDNAEESINRYEKTSGDSSVWYSSARDSIKELRKYLLSNL